MRKKRLEMEIQGLINKIKEIRIEKALNRKVILHFNIPSQRFIAQCSGCGLLLKDCNCKRFLKNVINKTKNVNGNKKRN